MTENEIEIGFCYTGFASADRIQNRWSVSGASHIGLAERLFGTEAETTEEGSNQAADREG